MGGDSIPNIPVRCLSGLHEGNAANRIQHLPRIVSLALNANAYNVLSLAFEPISLLNCFGVTMCWSLGRHVPFPLESEPMN